jgi:broad specificity polyphosphatase/5'/3'-nucleotidase SurE
MPVTTFSGTVEGGQVKLAANVQLPEKTRVYVVVPDFEESANGKKFDLAELVSQMPADYQATEEVFGGPVGKEEW